jgi:hypothetical protein
MDQQVIDISNRLNEEIAANDAREQMQVIHTQPVLLPCPEPGVYPGVDYITYARWEAASQSQLKKLLPPGTPAHLKVYRETPPKKTPALLEGDAYHCAILEPHAFEARFVTLGQCEAIKKGDKSRCTNNANGLYQLPGSDDMQAFCGTHRMGNPVTSRVVLTPEIFDNCRRVRDKVWQHTAARALLETVRFDEGDTELSIVWVDRQTGLKCKARIDAVSYPFEGMIDLKSAACAEREQFRYAIKRFGYHIQGSFYGDGARRVLNAGLRYYYFLAFEKVAPWGVSVFRLGDASLAQGRTELEPLLATYKECTENDHWPCYSELVDDIDIADTATAPVSFVEM